MPSEIREQPAIASGVERVRRQRRQPAGEIVAGGRGERDRKVREPALERHIEPAARRARLGLALESGEAERRGLNRGDRGEHHGLNECPRRSLAARSTPTAVRTRSLTGRSFPRLAAARRCSPAPGGTPPRAVFSAPAPTRRWQQSPSLQHLARVQLAQHLAVEASPPNPGSRVSAVEIRRPRNICASVAGVIRGAICRTGTSSELRGRRIGIAMDGNH